MRIVELVLLIYFAVATGVNAAVYKWVDNDGQVHFSQTPPPKNEAIESSTLLNQQIGLNAIEPLTNGSKVYCGRLFVMDVSVDDQLIEENINLSIDDWVAQRQQFDSKRQADPKLETQYAEYDCRVRWGYQQLQVLRSFEYQSDRAYEAMQKELKDLTSRRERECSTDPHRLGKSMLVGKEADDWGRCYNHYYYKIRDLKIKMNENRESLRSSY